MESNRVGIMNKTITKKLFDAILAKNGEKEYRTDYTHYTRYIRLRADNIIEMFFDKWLSIALYHDDYITLLEWKTIFKDDKGMIFPGELIWVSE